jgi:hypothetical protein
LSNAACSIEITSDCVTSHAGIPRIFANPDYLLKRNQRYVGFLHFWGIAPSIFLTW